jgi:flagellar basal body-associated protein FliL
MPPEKTPPSSALPAWVPLVVNVVVTVVVNLVLFAFAFGKLSTEVEAVKIRVGKVEAKAEAEEAAKIAQFEQMKSAEYRKLENLLEDFKTAADKTRK